MKKTVMVLAAMLVALGATAQDTELIKARSEFHREHSKRVPMVREGMKEAPQTKMTGANSTASTLPADRWFPGEWEEVQAIVVTWPYLSMPADWESMSDYYYWQAMPVFSGYGDLYKYVNGRGWTNQGFGPIDQIPYCIGETMDESDDYAEDRAYTSVFAYLIDAIRQGGAEPWVRVTHLSDSVYIHRHMNYLGLDTTGIKWIEGFGDAFWFRDCGPICFYYGEGDTVGMLDFQYYGGRAIDDSLPQIIQAQKNIPLWTTSIEWEGGNCIVDGDGMVMSSEEIYNSNGDTRGQILWAGPNTAPTRYESKAALSQQRVRDSLAYLMGPRGVKILPRFQYDGGTGHVDLYADMLDENQFVFSKFPENYSRWTDYSTAARNIDSICSWTSTFGNLFRSDYIPFPSMDDGSNFASQSVYTNYTRTYSNHTFVNNVIVQPCFSEVVDGMPTASWDSANIEVIKAAYPGYEIYPIDVRSFDGSGGAIHCITKQIPAENPIRILHASIRGRHEELRSENAVVSARISNRSGVAEAKVRYRVAEGEWQEVAMQQGGDGDWTAEIPTTGIGGDDVVVSYYITATSNNGKSIDKPYTAKTGGAYRFGWGESAGVEVADAEEGFGQFYPNPATARANMEIDLGDRGTYKVYIIDAAGRCVHNSTLQAAGRICYTVDTSRLPSGLYMVVFDNGSERVSRKLVKN